MLDTDMTKIFISNSRILWTTKENMVFIFNLILITHPTQNVMSHRNVCTTLILLFLREVYFTDVKKWLMILFSSCCTPKSSTFCIERPIKICRYISDNIRMQWQSLQFELNVSLLRNEKCHVFSRRKFFDRLVFSLFCQPFEDSVVF